MYLLKGKTTKAYSKKNQNKTNQLMASITAISKAAMKILSEQKIGTQQRHGFYQIF